MARHTKELEPDLLEAFEDDTESFSGFWPTPVSSAETPGDPAHLVLMFGASVGSVFCLDQAETRIGRGINTDICLSDRAVSRTHLIIARDDRGWTAVDQKSRNGSYLNNRAIRRPRRLRHNDVLRLGANSAFKFIDPAGADASHTLALYNAATTDFLTGIANRRSLDDTLLVELSFCRRHAQPLAFMLMDLDHFKTINDTHGHQAGDAVLKEFAELVQRSVRTEDHVGRYGGEEFAVISRATTIEGARLKAERIRTMVQEHAFQGGQVSLTVSTGVTGLEAGTGPVTPQALLASADAGLYEAKAQGRNRVVSVQFELEPGR